MDKRHQIYIDEVMKFRKALNLTSIDDPVLFYDRFVAPSIALLEWMPAHGRLLDIGSGMGVPGIPLLVEATEYSGVLVERRKKRAEFLRHLVRKLKLNAEVYDADINALPHLGVDVCVARAVTDEDGLLAMCTKHVNAGGVAVLPVPRVHAPSTLTGWHLESEHAIGVDGENADHIQSVRCYRYQPSDEGGFT